VQKWTRRAGQATRISNRFPIPPPPAPTIISNSLSISKVFKDFWFDSNWSPFLWILSDSLWVRGRGEVPGCLTHLISHIPALWLWIWTFEVINSQDGVWIFGESCVDSFDWFHAKSTGILEYKLTVIINQFVISCNQDKFLITIQSNRAKSKQFDWNKFQWYNVFPFVSVSLILIPSCFAKWRPRVQVSVYPTIGAISESIYR